MYFLCHLKLKPRSHMLPTAQDVWGGSVSTAFWVGFFNCNTGGFYSKRMFHSARDCQNPASAPKSLQSLLLLSPSSALMLLNGAFEMRVKGIISFFWLQRLISELIFKAPHCTLYPEGLCSQFYPPWNLWPWAPPEILGAGLHSSRCPAHWRTTELHVPLSSPTSPRSSLMSITPSW